MSDLRRAYRDQSMAQNALDQVVSEFGLAATGPGEWRGHGRVGEPARGCSEIRFDRAVANSAGTGLFAKAHATLLQGRVPVAHLKVAIGERAAQAISHESSVLAALEGAAWGVALPRVLSFGHTESGVEWSAQQVVGTRRAHPSPRRIAQLAASIASARVPTPPFPVPSTLARQTLSESAPRFTAHGDLIPANIVIDGVSGANGGRCAVVDWEWATPDGLWGFDICHYFLGGALSRPTSSPLRLEAGLRMATSCLNSIGGDVQGTLMAYSAGMSEFYGWCASQEEHPPADEPVVANARLLSARMTRGMHL